MSSPSTAWLCRSGQGPFNDVVIPHDELARVHGELEVREDGSLAFRARASSTPTRVVRSPDLVQESDGVEEQTFFVQPGDVIYVGDEPAATLEIVAVDLAPRTQWSHRELLEPAAVTIDEELGRLLFQQVDRLTRAPSHEHLLRVAVVMASRVAGRVPRCVELAVPVEIDPWRSDDYRLQDIAIDASQPGTVDDVDGSFLRTRDPLPPFEAEISVLMAELQKLDRIVLVESHTGAVNVLVPLAVDAELAGVLDMTFRPADVEDAGDALARLGALLQPLAAIVLGHDRQLRRCEATVEENRYWRERQHRHYLFKDLVAESEAVREVYDRLNRCVDNAEPVLIVGEAGSGKALVARALHQMSRRKDALFTSINCRELSGDLLDFELFGSIANELSGDVEPRMGVFELADGGTVFLEEVDGLSLLLQGKLLRMLREKEVRRIGDAIGRRVDVRVVVSTHRDLSALVNRGQFRRDLHLALSEHMLRLPPLRDRRADLLPLARTFLRNFSERYDRPCRRISSAVEDKLLAHRWDGNVRELQSVMEAAVLKCEGEEIGVDDLGL